MDKNTCESITTLAILKFIIKSINPDIPDIKLIFIGPQTDKTKDILQKLENKNIREDKDDKDDKDDNNYVHSILSSSENKYLEKIIPYYVTKFGNISNYNIFFIYKFIEENLPIEHIRIILYEIIKKKKKSTQARGDTIILLYHPLTQVLTYR